jgi:TonB-dependent receptor
LGIVNQDDRGRYYIGNYVTERTSLDNIYSGFDEVKAIYGMVSFEILKRLKFVGGARYEKSHLFVESAAATRPENERIGEIDDSDVLPSFNLIYPLKEDMNIRASFSKTIAKPNLREIAPFIAFDPLINEFYFGNTQLKKTDIDNYDLRWEWFMNPGEVIAISGYYKEFTNPISLLYRKSSNPEIQFTNVEGGHLFGAEFELRKSLAPFGGVFNNFRFGTNVSVISSSLDVIDLTGLEPTDRPFEGQSPLIVNAILNYNHPEKDIDATLAFNYLGDRLHIIGREGTPDIYDREHSDLNFTFIKRFGDLQVKVNVDNILNSPYTLSSDYLGEEYVYSKFKTGLTYGMSLNYTIK